ncbi:MAG TPA: hypothetical protein VFQ53_24800 [Kofleriaceae bacterium]|nr:hypothetical protein [Kofleriaceae bacterium]
MTTDDDYWNGSRYDASSSEGHYESWFLRANDAGGRAFWIRYTIFAPKHGPRDAVGELWAIVFDRARDDDRRVVPAKQVHAMTECSFARDRLAVTIGAAKLDATTLVGSASANGHTIAWDLQYGGGGPPLLLLPERLYTMKLPRAKALVNRPLATFSGTITVDGEPLTIDSWVGSQNHNWGSRHTDRYAWGQVAGFDERPDAFLECSTARLKLGPVMTPPMSPVVLRLGDEVLGYNGLTRAARALGAYAPYQWHIETTDRQHGTLDIRIHADPADFVALRYANPPGGTKICLNSKVARCELTLRRPDKLPLVLHSSRAAFEIVDDTAPPGITPAV